jgi:hypothetical protein
MIYKLFLIWFVYLMIGTIWLNYILQKNIVKEYNVMGSLIIVITWPLHIFYTKLKK